jgi:ubiquinone/menaquinone biosynthesis C-methylase UbiE
MANFGECGVYERIAASGVTDGLARPGGVALTERALSLCAFPPGSRILDVGCGTGTTVEHLNQRFGFFTAGVDPSLPMIAQGHARNSLLPLVRAAGEGLPFPDAQWDGVFAECSLSLSRNPPMFLRECFRVLRDGGRLILNDVYVRNAEAIPELRALSMDCCLTGALSIEELTVKLRDCGFAVSTWEDHSAALKQFAAQLIFSQGSARSFWCSLTGGEPLDALKIERAVSRAKPGYFLAIAEKKPHAGMNPKSDEELSL